MIVNAFWTMKIIHIVALLPLFYSNLALATPTRYQRQTNDGKRYCGCQECTAKVLNTIAGGYSCGNRMKYLMEKKHFNESEACERVGGIEFVGECGKCNPNSCDGRQQRPHSPATTTATAAALYYCGCQQCTQEVWERMDPSCGARITYLKDVLFKSTSEACAIVGGLEFPQECGPCNPLQCSKEDVVTTTTSTTNTATDHYYFNLIVVEESESESESEEEEEDAMPMIVDQEGQGEDDGDEGSTEMTLTARTDLYCFPPYQDRTRYRNVWGKYTVEAKEGTTCGPSNNKFTTNTVSLIDDQDGNNNMIKLQFRKVGALWEASEVRVRLPEEQMPFVYGRFSFSIQSVKVIDTRVGEVIDNVLPPSIILGLFTWDDTESFADKENMNHEVDIEISRWNYQENADLQFLVQPPGNPQKARFFSGDGRTYQQAPRTFSFDWRPGEIEWFGDHGEHHLYTVQGALDAGTPDYTQCLPADVEVRMNLWNLFGTAQPTGMADHHMVEVVVDDFSFRPSGLTHVQEGGACTKNCQCGTSATCINNQCRRGSSTGGHIRRNLVLPYDEEVMMKDFKTSSSDEIHSITMLRAENLIKDGCESFFEVIAFSFSLLVLCVGLAWLVKAYKNLGMDAEDCSASNS